jgi:hypothetical protein
MELCLRWIPTLDFYLVNLNLMVDFATYSTYCQMQDGADQSLSSIASECCGLITILTGTILLHAAKEKKAASHAGNNFMRFYLFRNIYVLLQHHYLS